jgi:acyl carrier protein
MEPKVPSAPVVEEKDALAVKVKCLAVEVEVEDGPNDEDEGRIAKRLAELALLEQAYIRDDKVLVKEHVKPEVITPESDIRDIIAEQLAVKPEVITPESDIRDIIAEQLAVKPEVITPESDIRDIIAAQTAAKADAKPAGEAPSEATVEAEATAVTEPVAEFPAVEEAKAVATAGGPIAAQVKEQAGEKPITFRRVLLNTGQEEFEGADALREEIKKLMKPKQALERDEKEEAPVKEEEEEELVDPKAVIENLCKPKCVKQLLALQACEELVHKGAMEADSFRQQ